MKARVPSIGSTTQRVARRGAGGAQFLADETVLGKAARHLLAHGALGAAIGGRDRVARIEGDASRLVLHAVELGSAAGSPSPHVGEPMRELELAEAKPTDASGPRCAFHASGRSPSATSAGSAAGQALAKLRALLLGRHMPQASTNEGRPPQVRFDANGPYAVTQLRCRRSCDLPSSPLRAFPPWTWAVRPTGGPFFAGGGPEPGPFSKTDGGEAFARSRLGEPAQRSHFCHANFCI